MVSEELISLIVPVYKVENYLDRCLESLVNQTYENLEILLIDDGSPEPGRAERAVAAGKKYSLRQR